MEQVSEGVNDLDTPFLIQEIPIAISQSLEGIKRVSEIVQAMKDFSHPGVKEKTLLDINHALETTLAVAKNEWKYVANLETAFDQDLPKVLCIPGAINQVFLNIIVNAAHAIASICQDEYQKNGIIQITTRKDGDFVEVRIADNGPGIPEEIQPKIFEPFFTTKEVGKGTGQGLAIAYDVITSRHKGQIYFETEVGVGTTFVIRLPIR
jgi:signal transduction histidine kinase